MAPRVSKLRVRRLLRAAPIRHVLSLVLVGANVGERFLSVARTAVLLPQSDDVVCHRSVEVKYSERITLGRRVIVGPDVTLGAYSGICLGDDVHLSKGVTIETAGLDFSGPPPYPHAGKPIIICEGVWIGAHAMVLGGVTIGRRAIIGGGAIVSKDVPAFAVVTGQPARTRLRTI